MDRGSHSLETIILLLALKVEYPNSVHLLRGNHEAADINAQFGFRCVRVSSTAFGRRSSILEWAMCEGRKALGHAGSWVVLD